MRTPTFVRLLLAFVLAFGIPWAFAQKAAGTPTAPKYDVSREVTIKGAIDDVTEMAMAKGEAGVHLMVKTATEMVEVRLCPSGYLKEFEVTFSKGQQVEVTGSKLTLEGKEFILARKIVQGNNTLTLRDEHGAPVWTWLKKN